MSRPTTPPPLEPERLRHAPGEGLLSRDFDNQAAQDDQRRWWHNRAVHSAYGVVAGLDVYTSVTTVVVAPGIAYDSYGRELVLVAEWRGDLPLEAEELVLVIARDGGAVVVRWLPGKTFSVRDGVCLALVAPSGIVDAGASHHARPLARPRLGHGATVPKGTPWTAWEEIVDGKRWFLGLEVEVDTSAAGFTDVPCYFAQLTGSMWDPRLPNTIVMPFQHIAQADKDHFTYRLLAPWLRSRTRADTSARVRELPVGRFGSAVRGLATATELAVTWIGVQHHAAAATSGGHRAIH